MTAALRHFLDLDAIDGTVLRRLIDDARARKKARAGRPHAAPDDDAPLKGYVLALLFEKPSTRTRTSFDIAMRQLGGQPLTLDAATMQLGRGETIGDTARVLSRYVDAMMIRTTAHDKLLDMAAAASVPVINGLTDHSHPCQIMADILTFEEHKGPIGGRIIAWVGDGNNVATSWIHAAVKFGFTLRLACPPALQPAPEVLDWAKRERGRIEVVTDPRAAVAGAECVVTDTWISMGDKEGDAKRRRLAPYQVNADLMAAAAPGALFMHCLPAHRGEEVTDEVIDGPHSVVFDGAENRLHAQKSILVWCLSASES